ncbi:TolB family protein [Maribacter antarcticus]|uniref:TolB family protein n=1 Tax=Maribacter antarcticus TaxID=505250 RepID=UPI00047AD2D1|nr:hypothetical protein [Maribacter antarcticus]
MNLDSSHTQRITNNLDFDVAPRWTPNVEIMFVSVRNNASGVYIINTNGTNLNLISPEDFLGGSRSSSPDGKSAVVEYETEPKWTEETEYLRRGQIFIIHANDNASIQVTNI